MAAKINPGPKLAGGVDVLKAIAKKTYTFVRKRSNEEEGGISLTINKVGNDGVIDLDASEVSAEVPHRGETIFAVNERLRLSDGPSGPRLEIMKIRRLPVEE